MAVTIRDIAKQLGISHSTVSRALKNDARISLKTRKKVKETAEAMGYRVNIAARALSSGHMSTIALVVPDVLDPFYASIVSGVDNAIRQHNYSLLLYITHAKSEREHAALVEAREGRYDGIILFRRHASDDILCDLKKTGIPIVLLTRQVPTIDSVRVNDFDGGRRATQFLIDFGHQKVGFIGGPRGLAESEDRHAGYRHALESNTITVDERLIWWADFREEDGREIANIIAAASPDRRPTAVFAANDRMAIGLQKRLIELGFDIPTDVSIIGYDDIEPSKYVLPKLTTVRQPTVEMGVEAAKLLLKRLQGASFPPQDIVLETEIVVRGSCRRFAGE